MFEHASELEFGGLSGDYRRRAAIEAGRIRSAPGRLDAAPSAGDTAQSSYAIPTVATEPIAFEVGDARFDEFAGLRHLFD